MKSAVLLGSLFVLSELVLACAGPGHASPAPPMGKGTPTQNLTNAYLAVQTRLGLDDFGGARAACGSVRSAAQAAELALEPELRKRIDTAASAGAAASDIVGLRAAFAPLSEALLAWFKTQTNPLSETIAVVHCPMALEGKGARWLQRGTQLKNPYFGAQMLACGSIVASLEPAQKL